MQDQTISGFLEQLAAKVPAPGGGASAALHAAQGAALLGMVARYSTGEKYAGDAEAITRIRTEADRLRGRAVELAAEDAAAFTAVTDAYRLPKGTDAEKDARGAAIAAASAGAAKPPADTITLAGHLVGLAEELLPIANRNVVTDVAAAAEAARAALTTARVNVEVNLAGVRDGETHAALGGVLGTVDDHVRRAERLTEQVRAEIAR
ncbi:formiminotransferase-cyclodeaminase [Microtetraspora sp. NBRC 13810]|uniref:cyclodeaminase/cyclohydrolase family protein n=1 Tax=Microtetraspora sp. NBRC 13810 TaxID=3030990 RepID=UPI0024A3008D|nr:cyclodeaminase/cyclohydrolase family protein [Microtetraspora sp. NBRC 13810]GLW06498.1 formiminotransferase-cyclodeaminase [Microtetraspora sp. NBRC 13810]